MRNLTFNEKEVKYMPINRAPSSPVILARAAAAASGGGVSTSDGASLYAEGDTNLKPPDYHLPFTGEQVTDALWKIINLNLNEVGGITKITSTEDAPTNLDTIMNPGNYMTDYITGATVPEEFAGMKPININVAVKTDPTDPNAPNTIIQIVESGGNKYYRWTKDNGVTWSQFAPKSTNSGPIDTTVDPTKDPPKDPVTVLEERTSDIEDEIADIKVSVANSLRLGTTEIGTQIMNGTFDYDTVIPVPSPTPAPSPAA